MTLDSSSWQLSERIRSKRVNQVAWLSILTIRFHAKNSSRVSILTFGIETQSNDQSTRI
jgi:hypothetical protein